MTCIAAISKYPEPTATCFSSRPIRVLPATGTSTRRRRWLLAELASGRLSLAGLVTHKISPAELGTAYEGLLKKKEEYLGVVVKW